MLATLAFVVLCMQEQTPGAFVAVKATPSIALAGQPVVISGSTGYHEKAKTAKIVIRHESSGTPVNLSTPVSSAGSFTVTFTETKKAGKYSVDVTAPDGKGKGSTSFKVTSISGLADELDRAFTQLDDRAEKLLQFAHDSFASLPASKDRDDVVNKVIEIENRQRTVDLPPILILGELRKVTDQPNVVYLPEQKIIGELQTWIQEADETSDEIDRSKVLERSKDSVCETINTAIEGCKFASIAFNVGKSGLDTLRKVFLDKAIPSIVTAAMGDNAASLAVSSGLKSGAAGLEGKVSLIQSIPGLILDVVEFGTKHLYSLYCATYEGPFKAKMTMVWNENSVPWMKYSVHLEGRISLRFALKNPPGQPIGMTGEIEGNAVKHEFWEDVFVVEPLPKGVLLLDRKWLPPPAFPLAAESVVDVGAILRTATPASFNVPLAAQMQNDKVSLVFKPARVDFSPLMTHRKLLVVFNGLMPDFTVFKVPIQPAFWILSKGFGDSFEVEVKKNAAGARYAAKSFTAHRETADKGVVVDWQIAFDTSKKSVSELKF